MKARSRAHYAGVSVAKLRRQADRFAAGMRAKAEKLAYDWQDVDNTVVGDTDALLRALDEWRKAVDDSLEYLAEAPE